MYVKMKMLRAKKVFLGIFLTVFSLFTVNAFALTDGKYTADTNTYYLNPDTGKTDDGGTGNAEIGEGMCRSAVFKKALLEVSSEKKYITMRMQLYSNLTNIRIATQDGAKGKYTSVKYNIVKESSSTDSADLKFEIPAEGNYIQIKMYVAPMGRDVCFYWNIDTSTIVSGDVGFSNTNSQSKSDDNKFVDINSHWAEKSIYNVVEKGLFSGTSEITFGPDKEMTRGMFVTVLGRMSGENIKSLKANFSDVSSSKYYAPYIAWANKNNIVSGISETKFNPDSPITCEQAAVILTKYAKYKNITFSPKSISPSTTGVSSWAKESVISAAKGGIITKQNTNGYSYTSSATRADVASMVSNFMDFYGK